MVASNRKKTKQEKLLNVMAKNIDAAGYTTIAKDVRNGKDVQENVTFFLKQLKKSLYGKYYAIKADGSIDRTGKISPESRKVYDRIEKWMHRALEFYEKE